MPLWLHIPTRLSQPPKPGAKRPKNCKNMGCCLCRYSRLFS
nr:MAG TPA: hypothetical protein [Caudoviricetes sp.]